MKLRITKDRDGILPSWNVTASTFGHLGAFSSWPKAMGFACWYLRVYGAKRGGAAA